MTRVDPDADGLPVPLDLARQHACAHERCHDVDLNGTTVPVRAFPPPPLRHRRQPERCCPAVVRLDGHALELVAHVHVELCGDGLVPHLGGREPLQPGPVGLHEPLVEPERGVGHAVAGRRVRLRVDVLPRLEVAEVDQPVELVPERAVDGEPGPGGDLVPLRLPARDRVQDRPVLRHVAEPLLLLERRLDEEPDFAAGVEEQPRRVLGHAPRRVDVGEVTRRPPEHAVRERPLAEVGHARELGGVPVPERPELALPLEPSVERAATARERPHRADGRAREDYQERPLRPGRFPNRVELGGHLDRAGLVVAEVLELVEDDDERLGRPELQEEPEDGPPRRVVLGPDVLTAPGRDGRDELAAVDLGRRLRRREEEDGPFAPPVGEQVRLPHPAAAGDEREGVAAGVGEGVEPLELGVAVKAYHNQWNGIVR